MNERPVLKVEETTLGNRVTVQSRGRVSRMSVEQLTTPPVQNSVFSDHLQCHIQDSMSSSMKQEHCYLPSQVVPIERVNAQNGPLMIIPFVSRIFIFALGDTAIL